MNQLFNLVRVTTPTTGTGLTIALGSAVLGGFLTFAGAGVPDGAQVTYALADPTGGGREVGRGTYDATAGTVTVTKVYRSSGAGNTARISLSGTAELALSVAAEDLADLYDLNSAGYWVVSDTAAYLDDGRVSEQVLIAVDEGTVSDGVANGFVFHDEGFAA